MSPEHAIGRVAREEWLSVIERDYLSDYIPSGGSAVKFVSGSDDHLAGVSTQLCELARSQNYYSVVLDSDQKDEAGKNPDLHQMHKLFFAITRDVDWKSMADKQVQGYFESKRITVPEGSPVCDLETIAQANQVDASVLLQMFEEHFRAVLMRDRRKMFEFRSALGALARAQLDPNAMTPLDEDVLLQWFRGRKPKGGLAALKRILIYSHIGPTNARSMLSSFCRWLPEAGYRGLMVVLDLRAYQNIKPTAAQQKARMMAALEGAASGGLSPEAAKQMLADLQPSDRTTYTPMAFMNMVSLMRRFIDEIDHFERFMLVVLTDPSFYSEASARNYTLYNALQTRIAIEVHDVKLPSPTAALVHLGVPA